MTDAELTLAQQRLRIECVRLAISAKERGDRTELLKLSAEIAGFVVGDAKPEVVVGHAQEAREQAAL
jgi:hypothetical protein